jgi:hypothetical protein
MAKYPDARYATPGALAAAFGEALAGTATAAAPPGVETRVVPRRPGHPRRRRRLIAAALLLAALGTAVAAVLATRGPSGGPSTNGPALAKLQTFVDRIENVLDQAAAGRQEIGTALTAGFACSIPPREAGRRIASVADNRQSILGQLGSLQAPTQQADEAVTLLQQALQQSIEADRHYRDGFFAVTGCPLPPDPSFDLARRSDARATAAKRRFVAAFDPLAERFDRRTWSAGGF